MTIVITHKLMPNKEGRLLNLLLCRLLLSEEQRCEHSVLPWGDYFCIRELPCALIPVSSWHPFKRAVLAKLVLLYHHLRTAAVVLPLQFEIRIYCRHQSTGEIELRAPLLIFWGISHHRRTCKEFLLPRIPFKNQRDNTDVLSIIFYLYLIV